MKQILLLGLLFFGGLSQLWAQPLETEQALYDAALSAIAHGNKREGEQLLEAIIQRNPKHAGAWLDLAFLYCDAGDEQSAYVLFQRIDSELNPPPAIRNLVSRIIENQGCQKPKRWLAQIDLAVGYGSNVNYAPITNVVHFAPAAPFGELYLGPQNRPRSDKYLSTEFLWVLPSHPDNLSGAQWQFWAQAKQHEEASAFNSQVIGLNATWRGAQTKSVNWQHWGVNSWEASTTGSYWQLGGKPYERSTQFWLGSWSTNYVKNGITARWGYEGGLTEFFYFENPAYNSIRWDARLRTQSAWYGLGIEQSLLLSAGPLIDRAINHRPGGDRNGYFLGGQWTLNLQSKRQIVVFLQHQKIKEKEFYSPIFFGETQRNPTYQSLNIRYQMMIEGNHKVYVDWLAQRTLDGIDIFSYKNQQLKIGYQWIY